MFCKIVLGFLFSKILRKSILAEFLKKAGWRKDMINVKTLLQNLNIGSINAGICTIDLLAFTTQPTTPKKYESWIHLNYMFKKKEKEK